MDEEAGKIFVGGLSWETSDDGLKNYFQTHFGEVQSCTIMRDQASGRSRGFGFVTFRDSAMVQKVLAQTSHMLDGRQIDPKAAVPRGSGPPTSSAGRGGGMGGRGGRGGGTGPGWRNPGMDGGAVGYQGATKKIFIGGIGHGTTEDDIKAYFQTYGNVVEVIVKYDQKTNRMRGFGFVSFDNETSVDRLCEIHFHTINGKTVEVKKAEPRQAGNVAPMGTPVPYGMGRGGPTYSEAPYGYASTYAQPRGYGPPAGYGAPQPYSSGYGNPGYGQAPGYPAPGGAGGYGYSAAGYGQSGPTYGGQYGQAAGYGSAPSQGYGSQAQASGYDSYGTASSQPSQGQDYSSSNTNTYNYGGAAGRMTGGFTQEQSPYGTPQTSGYAQDRSSTYGGQPTGYGQTSAGAGAPTAGAADATSYGQQATAGYGSDYRTPQSFGQGAAGGPQQARPYGSYQ